AGVAPLAFFPMSIYLGFPDIKKAASRRGNRRARMSCREGSTVSQPAARHRFARASAVSGQLGKSVLERSCRPAGSRSAWSLKKVGSGLANSASRREVRNKSRVFQSESFRGGKSERRRRERCR